LRKCNSLFLASFSHEMYDKKKEVLI